MLSAFRSGDRAPPSQPPACLTTGRRGRRRHHLLAALAAAVAALGGATTLTCNVIIAHYILHEHLQKTDHDCRVSHATRRSNARLIGSLVQVEVKCA